MNAMASGLCRVRIAVGLLCLGMASVSSGTTILEPPVPPYGKTTTISSPWGPRINPVQHTYEKHPGIDYPSPSHNGGEPIEAVEGGTIVKVDKDGSGDWYIAVRGATTTFLYLHIFDNLPVAPISIPGVTCVLSCLWHTATLNDVSPSIVDLVDLGDSVPGAVPGEICFGIVFWGPNGRSAPPAKVLTSIDCAGGSFAGTIARGTVSDREVVAPIGNSGMSTGPHVHLDANWEKTNPLVYVDHPTSSYAASFYQSPKGGSVYLDVIYTTGWDLDGAAFAIVGNTPAISIVIFDYGGSPYAPTCSAFTVATTTCIVVCAPATSCALYSDGESLGILPTSEKGRVKFVVPIPNPGFPPPQYPCNHVSSSCFGPPSIQDLPTWDVTVSPFNVCGYESPATLDPFYYRPSPVTWIQLPNLTNVFPAPGAVSLYAPLIQAGQSCPFGVVH